jgi:exopolyphosphatase / guanosine-5'-triphosphate,3'-diphosphate pyrophosphatase
VSQVRERRFQQGQALTLGALALTERFVTTDPISGSEWKALRKEVARQLNSVGWLEGTRGPLVGLGGTIRNLAKIEAARQSYPLNSINGFQLSLESVERTLELLRILTLTERKMIPGLKNDRADIILPGAMVLAAVMNRMGVAEITISQNGLREGLFFEEFWRTLPYPVVPNVREFIVHNMARFYNYQERHANHVRFLACRLFDQLEPLHGYGATERELLGAAALLHDLGTVINYYDHHKYSEALVVGAGLAGFSPREVALIALLTRYHRKGTPTPNPYTSLLVQGDEERLTKLSAMLRLSEFLERGKSGLVRDVEVAWDDTLLCLTLVADEYPAIELWDTQRNAVPLAETAFGRPIMLYSTAEAKI